jgi:hypothetical protein
VPSCELLFQSQISNPSAKSSRKGFSHVLVPAGTRVTVTM